MCPLIVVFLSNVKYFWSTFWYTTIYSLEELLHFLLHFFQSQNRRLVDNPCHVQAQPPPKRTDNHGQCLFKTLSKSFSRPFLRASKQVRSQTTAKIPLSMLLRRKSATLGKLPPFKSQLTQKQAPSQPCLSFSGSEPLTQHLNNSSNFNCNPIFPPEMVKKPSF